MLGRIFMGRYEILRLLGEGGMGRVYLARQLDLGRQVVVKIMHEHIAADAKFRERFIRETLLMARFQHPYAVTLYDASLNDPQGPCIIMEYIRGVRLDQLLQNNGRLAAPRVGRLLYQLCEVLQAAHGAGIIHRDLKPANLMIVDADTPYELLKVMDFGLAKMLTPDQFTKITQTPSEFAVGTPGYMCPEQARGDEMDSRGDLYSVGVILYELLTGRLPFADRPTMDLLLAHVIEEPPSFSFVAAGVEIPSGVEEVVRKCLAKNPADRPRGARELADLYEAGLTYEGTYSPAPPNFRSTSVSDVPTRNVEREPHDPLAAVHYPDAWMPECIAEYKLRGFLHDVGGEMIASLPGRIHVRLGGRGCVYSPPRPRLSWLGIGRRGNIDMELRLDRADPARENQLRITVLLRSPGTNLNASVAWRNICKRIFCDLRGYLMGQAGAVASEME